MCSTVTGGLLYRFPPSVYPFYPSCPIRRLTGLLCPGCGATRALATLLHGHLRQAFAFNAVVVLLLPLIVVYLILSWKSGRWHALPSRAIALLTAVTVAFTVVRNLHSF